MIAFNNPDPDRARLAIALADSLMRWRRAVGQDDDSEYTESKQTLEKLCLEYQAKYDEETEET